VRFFRHVLRMISSAALGVAPVAKRFAFVLAGFDAEARRCIPQLETAPLTAALEAETQQRSLDWKDMYIRGLEMCAKAMGFREDALYEPEQLISRTLKFASGIEVSPPMDDSAIRTSAAKGSRYLMAWLYRSLQASGTYPQEVVKRLCDYPMETAAALFLKCLAD